MGLFEHLPYTNFHDLNLNWIIGKIKNVETAEANTAESAEAAAASAASSQLSAEASAASAEASQQSAEASQQSAEASQQSAEDAAETVSNTLNQINVLQSRVDNIIPQGTQTEGNTELLDIRVGYNGITYSSAGNAVRDQNKHQDETTLYSLKKYSDYETSDTQAVNDIPVFVKPGETVVIDIKERTGTNGCSLYVVGHTTPGLTLSKPERMFFTPQHAGYLRIYNGNYESAKWKIDIWIRNELNDLAADTDLLKYSVYEKKDINTLLEKGTLDTGNGQPVAADANIRSTDFLDESINRIYFNNTDFYARIYAYTNDDIFVGSWNNNGWTQEYPKTAAFNYSPIDMNLFENYSDYKYKIVFIKRSGTVQNVSEVSAHALYNKIETGEKSETYYVGPGRDFTTFTQMLTELQNNVNEKTVYIMPGVYDIFAEKGGAEYIQSVDTSANWRDVCELVPANTKIIGIGKVILKWTPSDTEIIDNDHAFLFSPLNVSGSCEIENINIECKNCRYGIHDETSGRAIYDGAKHIYKNVHVKCLESTYGAAYAYGAGHNKNMVLEFINCVFESHYGVPWSSHDWPASENEKSTFTFQNCVFKNSLGNIPGGVRFSSSDTAGRLDTVLMSCCELEKIVFGSESTEQIKQGYQVTLICCNDAQTQYTQYLPEADRIPPVKINTIN